MQLPCMRFPAYVPHVIFSLGACGRRPLNLSSHPSSHSACRCLRSDNTSSELNKSIIRHPTNGHQLSPWTLGSLRTIGSHRRHRCRAGVMSTDHHHHPSAAAADSPMQATSGVMKGPAQTIFSSCQVTTGLISSAVPTAIEGRGRQERPHPRPQPAPTS